MSSLTHHFFVAKTCRILSTTRFRIGMALTDSLDELITSGAITPQLAMKVLQQVKFDTAYQRIYN